MSFGANLRAARRRAGMTQESLAAAAGVSTETVSRVERGAFEPSLSTAVALAGVLGVDLGSLAGGRANNAARGVRSAFERAMAARAGALDAEARRALLLLADRAARGARR